MKKNILPCLLLCALCGPQTGYTQKKETYHPRKPDNQSAMYDKSDSVQPPVVTQHTITINGKTLSYTATTGYMPMRDTVGKLLAKIFYVAYTLNNPPAHRPVTFAFNGGPGSSSIWLHMGAISPIRANFADDTGNTPAPPYTYSPNPNTWLSFTDLVFIDPVSTGYSRAGKGVSARRFHGYSKDVASVGDFIRLYVTRNERWGSPKFLAGESYGTTRACGLSGYLQDAYGMYLNGITLISSVLNFEYIDFHKGNELPYVLFLPTYATTAQYYHKLSPALEALSPAQLAKKAEAFAEGTYNYFLFLGDNAPASLTDEVVDSLHYYTSISKQYIRQANERITDSYFFKELLRDEGKTIGRFDSRYTGEDENDVGEYPSYDPSYSALNGLFNGVFNEYVRKDLDFKSDMQYQSLTNVWPWTFRSAINSYLDVSGTLRSAMTQNPHLKVMVCCGYYDLATPFFNAEYAVDHMGLRKDVRGNTILNYYPSGHMIYVRQSCDAKLKLDAEKFYASAVK